MTSDALPQKRMQPELCDDNPRSCLIAGWPLNVLRFAGTSLATEVPQTLDRRRLAFFGFFTLARWWRHRDFAT
jgi:hypothetical protein